MGGGQWQGKRRQSGAGGPTILYQQALFINCQLGLCWDTAKGWLPIFSL